MAEGMNFYRPHTLSGLDVARVRHGFQVVFSLLLQIQLAFLTPIVQNHQETEVSFPQKSSSVVPLWSLVSNFSLPDLYLHGFFHSCEKSNLDKKKFFVLYHGDWLCFPDQTMRK